MKTIILNDTRRAPNHLGCVTVMSNLLHLAGSKGLEVFRTFTRVDVAESPEFLSALEAAEVVIVNGEGTMHHDAPGAKALARAVAAAHRAGKRTALLNAVWQDNVETVSCLEHFDFVQVRDSYSLDQIRLAGRSDALLAPDFSFYQGSDSAADIPTRIRSTYVERGLVVDSIIPHVSARMYDYAARHRLPFFVMSSWAGKAPMERHPIGRSEFLALQTLRRAPFILSGRFHAVCLAMKHGIPFVALSSNTHKIEALLEDAGLKADRFVARERWSDMPAEQLRDEAENIWAEHREQIETYVRTASSRIEEIFDGLKLRAGLATSLAC